MRRLLISLAVATLALAPSSLAAAASVANGGGHGTVDGTTPFSQFGFGVTKGADGSVQASFDGVGMFQTGNQGKSPATFHAEVTSGGPGVGTLRLTLLTPFFFPLPTERVLNGQISIH